MKTHLKRFLSCRFVRRRVADRIDRGESLDDRDSEHIRECSDCRHYAEVQRRLVAGLRRQASLPVASVDPAVRERILESIAAGPEPERPVFRWQVLVPVAGAAAAAAMVAIFSLFSTSTREEPGHAETFVIEHAVPVESLIAQTRSEEFDTDVYSRERDRLIADGRATARFLLSSFPVDFE